MWREMLLLSFKKGFWEFSFNFSMGKGGFHDRVIWHVGNLVRVNNGNFRSNQLPSIFLFYLCAEIFSDSQNFREWKSCYRNFASKFSTVLVGWLIGRQFEQMSYIHKRHSRRFLESYHLTLLFKFEATGFSILMNHTKQTNKPKYPGKYAPRPRRETQNIKNIDLQAVLCRENDKVEHDSF